MRLPAIAMMAAMLLSSAVYAQIDVIGDNTLPGPSENPVAVASWQGDLYYATQRDGVTHYGLSSAALPDYPFHQVFDVRDFGSELLILANEWVDSMYYPYYEILLSAFRWDGTALTKTSSYYSTEVELTTAGPATIYQGEVFAGGPGVHYPLRRYRGGTWRQVSVDATRINALEVIDGYLYALGDFTSIEAVDAQSIARFDGTSWFAFGVGLPGTANTVALTGGEYYATTDSELWRWQAHDDAWTKIADAAGGSIADVMAWNGDLILVGSFTSIDGVPADCVARYDGSLFHAVPGGPNGSIDSISPHGAGFVVEGAFLGTETEPAVYAAIYDGSTWSPARTGGLGVAPVVNKITSYGGEVLVSSRISTLHAPSTTAAYGLARYTPVGWEGLGGGIHGGDVREFLEHDGVLYIHGRFQSTGGVQGWPSLLLPGWATWDGTEWASMTPPPYGGSGDPDAYSLGLYEGQVIVGGPSWDFGQSELLARWDGVSWSSFPEESPLTGSHVTDTIEFDGKLFVCGNLIWTETVPGDHYALFWDGEQWNATNVSYYLSQFFVLDGELYAHGRYTYRWDTDHWANGWHLHPDTGEDLIPAGGNLYKSTSRVEPDGTRIGELVQWFEGTGWVKLVDLTTVDEFGNVLSGRVSEVLVDGETTYAVGSFTHVNGIRCDNFALWEGGIAVAVKPVVPSRKLAIRAFPNPANPVVSFALEQDGPGPIWVTVYDLRGRRVRRLVDGQSVSAGVPVLWDGKSDSGESAASGVYLARVRHGEKIATTKFTLVK